MGSSPSRCWVDLSTLRSDGQDLYLSIQHVIVYVRDQDRSLRFYLDQLGFVLIADSFFEGGGRWVAVDPSDGTALLALVSPKAGSEEYGRVSKAVLRMDGRNTWEFIPTSQPAGTVTARRTLGSRGC